MTQFSSQTITVEPKAVEKLIQVLGFYEFICWVGMALSVPIGLIGSIVAAQNGFGAVLMTAGGAAVLVVALYIQAVCAKGLSAIAAMVHNVWVSG